MLHPLRRQFHRSLVLILPILLLVSCHTEETPVILDSYNLSFQAEITQKETKTVFVEDYQNALRHRAGWNSTGKIGVLVSWENGTTQFSNIGAFQGFLPTVCEDGASDRDTVFLKATFGGVITAPSDLVLRDYTYYALYPFLLSTVTDITNHTLTLPVVQYPSQDSWYEEADYLVAKPRTIAGTSVINSGLSLEFDRLFSFLRISFGNTFQEKEYYQERVLQVKLTSKDLSNQTLAGVFSLNLTDGSYSISEYSYSNTITLDYSSEAISFKDLTAWFVVNPGNYSQIEIEVSTENHTLTFTRNNLSLIKGELTRAILSSKEGDVEKESKGVLLLYENFGTPSSNTPIASYLYWGRVGEGAQNVTYTVGASNTGTVDVRATEISSNYTGASGGGNVWFPKTNDTFYINGIKTNGANTISISLASYTSIPTIQYSLDGSDTWNDVSIQRSGTGWQLSVAEDFSIPVTTTSISLRFSFPVDGRRIDDLRVWKKMSPIITPSVTTREVTDVSATSAIGVGTYSYSGEGTISEVGIALRKTTGITYRHIAANRVETLFSTNLSDLESNTSYAFAAYAKIGNKYYYGAHNTFTTTSSGATILRKISSIRALSSNISGQTGYTITDNWKVKGRVVSNIASTGNNVNNKSLMVQDDNLAGSGLTFRLTTANSTGRFDLGDEVEITLTGGTLSYYYASGTNTNQLQFTPASDASIVKTSSENSPMGATTISVSQLLSGEYESMYIAIDYVKVSASSSSATSISGSINMETLAGTAEGGSFLMYTASFSAFSSLSVPTGTGTLRGLGARYQSNYQVQPQIASDISTLSAGDPHEGDFTDLVSDRINSWMELPTLPAVDDIPNGKAYVSHHISAGFRNFSMYYDAYYKYAMWVAYPLCAAYIGESDRTDAWGYDPKIPTSMQPKLSKSGAFYTNGYDRGHQLPSADRTITSDANEATFYYSNMTAQKSELNQKLWQRLEGNIRTWATECDTLYVVTGAVITTTADPVITYVQDNNGVDIPIPKAYFKVLLKRHLSNNTYQSIGYWMENRDYGNIYPSSDHIKSVAEIETLTGFTFFPLLPQASAATIKANNSSF